MSRWRAPSARKVAAMRRWRSACWREAIAIATAASAAVSTSETDRKRCARSSALRSCGLMSSPVSTRAPGVGSASRAFTHCAMAAGAPATDTRHDARAPGPSRPPVSTSASGRITRGPSSTPLSGRSGSSTTMPVITSVRPPTVMRSPIAVRMRCAPLLLSQASPAFGRGSNSTPRAVRTRYAPSKGASPASALSVPSCGVALVEPTMLDSSTLRYIARPSLFASRSAASTLPASLLKAASPPTRRRLCSASASVVRWAMLPTPASASTATNSAASSTLNSPARQPCHAWRAAIRINAIAFTPAAARLPAATGDRSARPVARRG